MSRLLLVEDEPVLADLLRTVLESSGHGVEVVHSVSDAITAFDRSPHDLIVSDFLLPDRTGLDLARDLATRLSPPPMVLVTAYLQPELQPEVDRQAAIVEVIRKPFDLFELRDSVERHLAVALAATQSPAPISASTLGSGGGLSSTKRPSAGQVEGDATREGPSAFGAGSIST